MHFHYNEKTEISVFYWNFNIFWSQDPRLKIFRKKVSPEILSLASWDQEILKFQYFTGISIFSGPKTQDSRFSEKKFPLKS